MDVIDIYSMTLSTSVITRPHDIRLFRAKVRFSRDLALKRDFSREASIIRRGRAMTPDAFPLSDSIEVLLVISQVSYIFLPLLSLKGAGTILQCSVEPKL